MTETNVFQLAQPGTFADSLTDVLREGAIGGRVEERSLVPLGEARLGRSGFDEWLRRSQAVTSRSPNLGSNG